MKLSEWFNEKDYEEGLKLYLNLIGEDFLYNLLKIGENSYTSEKLSLALENLIEKDIEPDEAEILEPEGISELKKRAQNLMDERSELKSILRYQYINKIDDTAKRTEAAVRIANLRPQLDTIFHQLKIFEEQGVELKEDSNEDEGERDYQELLNLRSYVTKYGKCLKESKTLHGADLSKNLREKYESKLAGFQIELEQLEKKFSNIVLEQ